MVECPWCGSAIELSESVCPECMHEILPEHLEASDDGQHTKNYADFVMEEELDLETTIMNRYKCIKCGHDECDFQEASVTGTGISKLLNISYQHYLLVSCIKCGYVEMYNPYFYRNGGLSL
ncbi:hypothetical protein D3C78_1260360 [compost metagenome]